MPWNENLSPDSPAFAIASSTANHIRVVAGPGTGKSFAMKRRVARLLESGVPPEAILPVTFTRVAAEDLHRELVQMQVPGCQQLNGVTLHSLALRALMRAHVLQATHRTPRPLNEFEIKPMIADLMGQFGGIRKVNAHIKAFEAAWARLQADEPGVLSAADLSFQIELLSWLNFHIAMLIGEVIPIFLDYLKNNPLAAERSAYSHILVDEYQDLNRAEQLLIHYLSDNADLCVVGDDDQSIYSFRHAHPAGIREWGQVEGFMPLDIGLNDCQRCPGRVVRLANSLIRHNQDRDPNRHLNPIEEKGEGVVRHLRYASVEAEVEGISNIVAELVASGTPAGSILVLTKRVIGTPIYEGLIERDIPVKSYYAEAELDTEFAQERFAYLKLLADVDDWVAIRWLVGLYGSNWHAAGYKRVRAHSEQTGISPWAVLEGLSAGQLQIPHTGGIVVRYEEVRARLDFINQIFDDQGMQALIDELFPEDDARVRDLRSLLNETFEANPEASPQEFVGYVNEAITKPDIPELVEDVRIMSLFKSKGLSALVTIVAGCVEGALPSKPKGEPTPAERAAHIEEQRRLLYVGITRVKARVAENQPGTLIVSSAGEMPLADAMQSGISPAQIVYGTAKLLPSRFLREFDGNLPDAVIG